MRSYVRAAGILMVAGLTTAACGDDGNGGGTDVTNQVLVTVTVDGSGESGLSVSLFEAGETTVLDEGTTNASGQVRFEDLAAGQYEVEVEVPSDLELAPGQTARRTVTAGPSASVTIGLVTPVPAGVTVVTLNATSFSPSSVTIDTGETVRWVNGAAINHTITPDGHSEWTSQTVSADGETFEHTFNNTGSFEYLCQIHAGMTGTITVQ